MEEIELVAITAFGMEALVVRELHDLGYENTTVEDGRVRFKADFSAIARCNLWLRCAERVQIVVGDLLARDFDELFDGVKALEWERWLPVDAKFPVDARCIRSSIRSAPNSQKMVKRSIVERLRKVYMRHWFAETGVEFHVEASMLGERALLTIDTTGDGLHKRGYRKLVGPAPLRETVAAALVKLSYWNRDRLLVDPFCGSGTIPIEAAMIGRNIAPGLVRNFAAEEWGNVPRSIWTQARQEARDLEDRRQLTIPIIATDYSRDAIKMSKVHARVAGVENDIHFEKKEFYEFPTNRDYGVLICNPPYGERMGNSEDIRQLYRDMGDLLLPLDDWSLYILTAFEGFEVEFGHRADRRRKLFNARIPCTYYQYLGSKPPVGFVADGGEQDESDDVDDDELTDEDFEDQEIDFSDAGFSDSGDSQRGNSESVEVTKVVETQAVEQVASEVELNEEVSKALPAQEPVIEPESSSVVAGSSRTDFTSEEKTPVESVHEDAVHQDLAGQDSEEVAQPEGVTENHSPNHSTGELASETAAKVQAEAQAEETLIADESVIEPASEHVQSESDDQTNRRNEI